MADLISLDELNDALNLGGDSSHDDELEVYIAAVTAHVEDSFGVLPSAEYTEQVPTVIVAGAVRLMPSRWPVLEVASITSAEGTEYTTGFTVATGGYVSHTSLSAGWWTITYTVGYATVPADLKLAALEDIRGLYQPGQIGPPAQFGAFGIDSTEVGTSYRPVRMWPRVDAWVERHSLPGIA